MFTTIWASPILTSIFFKGVESITGKLYHEPPPPKKRRLGRWCFLLNAVILRFHVGFRGCNKRWHCIDTTTTPPKTNTENLKINGWKMYFLLEILSFLSFLAHMLVFGGVPLEEAPSAKKTLQTSYLNARILINHFAVLRPMKERS